MLQLESKNRIVFGKKNNILIKEGQIPAVFYGRKKESTPISIFAKDFKKIWREAGESTIIELKNEDKTPVNVLIHDVAIDPVNDEPIHVDFYVVEMDKEITTMVPLVFIGVSPAVKELKGVLVKVAHEIEIKAMPKNLPHEISVDISLLKTFEDQITVKDLQLPSGVKTTAKEDEVIVLAELPKEEPAEEEKMTIADIQVEKRGKIEEEGAEGAEGGSGKE